jgi:predicted short-subunit dehydrogenase-like oxidoreductase (DUF2520 family)
LRARGAATGVFHPLAVLGAGGAAALSGAAVRIEGSRRACAVARHLAALAGLVPLRSRQLATPAGRRAYHAAASLASNDLIALLAAAEGVLVRRGVPRRDALRALTALAGGALRQVRSAGLLGALTGPVARNDGPTITAQLAALAFEDAAAAAAHRALSLRLIDLAETGGRLDRAESRALRARLSHGPRPRRTV